MGSNYQGLPAAASVERAIVLAQLMILRDLERRTDRIRTQADNTGPDRRAG
jgi:hypothetical protein